MGENNQLIIGVAWQRNLLVKKIAMKTIIDYVLKIQSDDVIEATILNTGQRRIGKLNRQPLRLAKAYAIACQHGVLDYLGEEAREAFQELGKHLYEMLFHDEIKGHFNEQVVYKYLVNNSPDVNIRLRLIFQEKVSPELLNLPWEFIYHHKEDVFLATHSKIMFSYQYNNWLNQEMSGYPYAKDELLRVLFVHTHPKDLDGVAVISVRKAIEQLQQQDTKFRELKDLSVSNLKQELETYQPHVFHFLGHGYFEQTRGAFALVNQEGNVFWYDDRSFSRLFESWKPKLIVLQSCQSGQLSEIKAFSGGAAWLIRQRIPAVVAWRYPFPQGEGWNFTKEFYSNLARGNSIDQAVQKGREALAFPDNKFAHSTRYFGAPILWNCLKYGQLFLIDKNQKFAEIIQDIETKIYVNTSDRKHKINALAIAELIGDTNHERIVKLLRTKPKYLRENPCSDRFQAKLSNIYHYLKKLLELCKQSEDPIAVFSKALYVPTLTLLKAQSGSLDSQIIEEGEKSLFDYLINNQFNLFDTILELVQGIKN